MLFILAIAGTAAIVAPEAEARGPAQLALYELRDGDTLSGIAAHFHVPAEQIAALNHLRNPNVLHGAGLLLPDVPSTKRLPRYTPWLAASKLEPCRSTPWSPLRTVRYMTPACANGPDGKRACVVQNIMTVTTKDGRTTRFEVPHSPLDPQEELADVDLDGDGQPETLISSHEATSNGIGHVFRTLVVLEDGKEILRYDSGELTATTAAILRNGGCHLASSHWETVKHPLRGEALYLVERSFDPATLRMDETVVGRRFSDKARFRIPFDPLLVQPSASAVAGTVVEAQGDLASILLMTTRGRVHVAFSAEERDQKRIRLGDARTGRVYPMDLEVPLVGRTVTLRRYGDQEWGEQVIWLASAGADHS